MQGDDQGIRNKKMVFAKAEGSAGSAVVLPMSLAGASGFAVAYLLRGALTDALPLLLIGAFCGYLGWCARGLE